MARTRRKRTTSLRRRIFIISILIALVPTIGVSWALMNSTMNQAVQSALTEVQGQAIILANQLQEDEYLTHSDTSGKKEIIIQISDVLNGRIQVIDAAGRIVTDTYDIDTGKFNISDYVLSALNRQEVSKLDSSQKVAVIAQPIFSNTEDELVTPLAKLEKGENPTYTNKVDGVLLVTVDITQRINPILTIQNHMYLLWIAAACLILIAVLIMVVLLFKPFKKLVIEIDEASDGTISSVSVHDNKETSQISDAVNASLERIKSIDNSRQEFISNVSHELKTPITSMRVLADSMNSMDVVPNEMYEEFMRDISNELEREGQIIDDLLQMSKLEEGAISITTEETNLNEWLEEILHRIKNKAKQAQVDIVYESFRPVTAEIDASKLSLAVTNLVENAIKYNNPGGWIKVSLNADHHYFFIKVEDSGIGIPEEDLPHIFDRFFRVEKDRSRESGGTGLGLAISKQIVVLHHGALKASSVVNEGTTFVLRIPLKFQEEEKTDEETNI